jgi:EF hand
MLNLRGITPLTYASLASAVYFAFGVVSCAQANPVQTIIGRPHEGGRDRPAALGGRFRQLDTNRDGRITRQEMEQGDQSRQQAFERADRNRDGELSQEEWVQYKASKKKRKRNAL